MIVRYLVLAVLAQVPGSTEPPVLRPGDVVEGTITEMDPVIHTEILDARQTTTPTRGKTYRIELPAPGPMTIELHSHYFDAYLVLRDESGTSILEDDNGLYRSHSRIVVDEARASPMSVDVCALHGETGAFRVSVTEGEPDAISPEESDERDLRDAREAVESMERVLGPDHPDTAWSLNSLGLRLMERREYGEARPLYERALRIWESTLDPEHPSIASVLNNLAVLLKEQGAYEEARPLYERALRIREAALGPEDPSTASSLSNLAGLLRSQGAYVEARPLMERALEICEATLGPDHPSTASTLNGLAKLLMSQAEYREARPLLERALRIRESTLGPDHPSTASTLNNLATLLHEQGAYEEARPLYERALGIEETALGPEHPAIVATLNNLAMLLRDQWKYEEARPYFERALRISEATYGPEHPSTAVALGNLAVLFRDQEEYEEARPLFERALRIRGATLGPEHPENVTILGSLALMLQEQGALEEARPYHERALAICEAAYGPDHPWSVTLLHNLAILEFDLGEHDSALRRSLLVIGGSRSHIHDVLSAMSETERLQFVRDNRWAIEAALSLLRVASDDRAARESLEIILGWKGQVRRSLIREGSSSDADATNEVGDLLIRLRDMERQMSGLLYAREIPDPAAHAERLKELRADKNRLEVELARSRGTAGDEEWEVDRIDVPALRDALPPDAAAIGFFIHDWYEPARWDRGRLVEMGRYTPAHLSAWVVRSGAAVKQFDLGRAEVVEATVQAFLRALAGENIDGRGVTLPTDDEEFATIETSDRLRALLWDPLAAAVGQAQTVFLSGDSFLGSLPFETLQREDGTFLIEHHAFTYLADLQSLPAALADERLSGSRLFAVGGVDYRKRSDVRDQEAPIALADNRASFSRTWRRLEGTVAETRAIAETHSAATGDDGSRLVLTGPDATEERIKQSLPDFTHIHLATHGYFHPEELPSAWRTIRNREDERGMLSLREAERHVVGYHPGLLSGLVFAGANAEPEPGRDNGLLTAEEISFLDLSDCDLVVLSACETGLGRPEAGEGMIGLRRAFRMAGARTVISSLWEVSDASTRDLMTLFYENLWLKEMPKLEALRQAQLSLLEHNRQTYGDALPSTWGAFVLDGAPN